MSRWIRAWSLCLFLIIFAGNAYAGLYIGSMRFELYNVQDEQNTAVSLERNIISVDVDMGSTYFTMYGALLKPPGEDGIPINGSGYFYDLSNGGSQLVIELRAGLYLYHLVLNTNTLEGSFFRMGEYGGTLTGSIKLVNFIPAS